MFEARMVVSGPQHNKDTRMGLADKQNRETKNVVYPQEGQLQPT